MATFSQQNRKLQKIFNDIKSNKSALDNRRNEQILLNFFKSINKAQISISDTGWIAKAPDDNDLKTITKGALLPESLSVIHSDQLEIPDFLLPYVDVQMMIKTPPDSVLTSYDKYTTENYTGDHIVVKGDSSNLFTGPPEQVFSSIDYVQENSLATFPLENTKRRWLVTISYLDGGTPTELTGTITQIKTFENTQTCSTTTIQDEFKCTHFDDIPSPIPYHKITAFSELGFTGIGDLTTRSFTSAPPDCDVSEVITTEITLSKTFADMDEYSITLVDAFSNETVILGSNITDIIIDSNIQYVLYYSSLYQRRLAIPSGSFPEDTLLFNFPDTNDGHILPYTSITLQRNIGSLASFLNTTIAENIFLLSSETGGNNIRKDFALFKIQDGNDNNFPYYHMKLGIGATILSPAIVDDPNPHVRTQIDSYGISGTTYARSNNETGLTSEAYITEKQDVQYRIMIIVKNPFWFQEIRKYGTSE